MSDINQVSSSQKMQTANVEKLEYSVKNETSNSQKIKLSNTVAKDYIETGAAMFITPDGTTHVREKDGSYSPDVKVQSYLSKNNK